MDIEYIEANFRSWEAQSKPDQETLELLLSKVPDNNGVAALECANATHNSSKNSYVAGMLLLLVKDGPDTLRRVLEDKLRRYPPPTG